MLGCNSFHLLWWDNELELGLELLLLGSDRGVHAAEIGFCWFMVGTGVSSEEESLRSS